MKIINILSILEIIVCCACQNHTFLVNQCPSEKVRCEESSKPNCTCSETATAEDANYTYLKVGENETIQLSTENEYKVIEYAESNVELEVSFVIVAHVPPESYTLLFQSFYFSQANKIYNQKNPVGFLRPINKEESFELTFYLTLTENEGEVEKLVIDLSIMASPEANITILVTVSKINTQLIIIIAASAASILVAAAIAFIVFCLYKRHKARVEEEKKIDYKEQLVEEFKKETPEVLAKTIHIPKMSTCSICLGDFDPEDKIRKTVCKHIFHSECIDSWCKKNLTCPVCRLDLDEESIKKKKKEIEMTDYNWQENPLSVREELLFDERSKNKEEPINKI